MDRRTFLRGTGGAIFGASVFGALRSGSASMPDCCSAFVFDPALAKGRALARHAMRRGVDAWPAADDIGQLWHAQLAPRLDANSRVIAALRPADAFVLTRLAATRGIAVLAYGDLTGTGSRDSSDRT